MPGESTSRLATATSNDADADQLALVGAEIRALAPAVYDEVLAVARQIATALRLREVARGPIFGALKRKPSA